MNMTFKIDIDRRKVEAIRCYMPDGNIEELLNEEITKASFPQFFWKQQTPDYMGYSWVR